MMNLYLNSNLVQSTSYSATAPNWSVRLGLRLGSITSIRLMEGFYCLDDVIDEFTVAGPIKTPPVVAMTAPANGSYVNGGTITVAANATDTVGVTGVQFMLDGANLGAVVTGAGPAYSISWNTTGVANGAHTLSAVATDTAGNTATSSVSVTMDNTPPAVSMTAPANGSYVNGGTVTATASTTDSVGVTGVQFMLDGANLGAVVTGAGPAYSVSWNTAGISIGPHTLSAVATDAAGNSATTSISVTMDTIAPTVSITAPANGTAINGGTITVTANATDGVGVTGVQFKLDGSNLGAVVTGAGPIYSVSWNATGVSSGPHTLSAVATDTAGNVGASSVSVTIATTAPAISITTPANGAYVNGGTITVTANATDSVGVTGVQFELDGVNLGAAVTGAGPTYSISWNTAAVTNGSHTLSAVATDAAGNTATASIPVTMNNTPPTVSMTSPASGSFVNGGTITVTANATDSVGVTGVQFKLDGTNLGAVITGAGPSYNLTWNTSGVANGPHTLSAVATDAAGNSSTATVPVTMDSTPPAVSITAPVSPAYVNGGIITVTATATDGVGVTGVQFELDGANLGAVITGAGPVYSVSWNAAGIASGPHTLSVVATDAAGNSSTATVPVTMDTTPPAVSITAPVSPAYVNGGIITVTATATDSVGVTGVQFELDGANLGGIVAGTGPMYSVSWNTAGIASGPHTLSAVAADTAKNTAASSVSVIMDTTLPTVSLTAPTAGSSVNGTVTITADASANAGISGVQFALDGVNLGSVVTGGGPSYSYSWNTLTAANGSHILSAVAMDLAGNTAASGSISVTVNNLLLQMHLDQTEVSGVTNGSVVTPSIAPAGFTGTVVANGTGSVNFTPAQTGDGVYFLNCCVNSNNAYYKFTGSTVGDIFNTSEGQIAFYLKSRYSFAERSANASGMRYAFDVTDGNGNHLFYFLTQVQGGLLFFNYGIAGTLQSTYLQPGTEDATFGNGVILQVQMTWSAGVMNLYLNGNLAQSTPSANTAPNWTSSSVFDLGAFENQTFGGFNTSDDVIDEFTVAGPIKTPPVVAMTAPANGSYVNGGTITVAANATDTVGVTGVQFMLDGANLGAVVTGAGPAYSISWNTTGVANGAHTLSAVATDTAGNTATSSVSVTMDNTPPAVSMTAPANGSYVNGGTVTATASTTDSVGVTGVQFMLDGANLGAVVTGAGPAYSVSWNTAGISIGPHTLSAVATDAAGNSATTSISVTMDTIAPTVSITAPANGTAINGGTITVTANATDGVGVTGVQFKLDGSNLGAVVTGAGPIYSVSWNATGVSSGPHTLSAVATDTAGNVGASSVSVTIATTAPAISITTPANGAYVNGGTITVTANATDSVGVTGVQFELDGVNLGAAVTGAGPTYSISWNTAAVTNGSHTLSAVATDAAGNTATASIPVTMNNTPPTVSMTSPASGSFVNGGTITVTANATDSVGVTGVQFKLDGTNLGAVITGAGPSYNLTWNTSGVANGPHTLSAVATDAAGNSSTATVPVTMDSTPPAVSITAPVSPAYVNGGIITVTATATDGVGVTGVQFELDGANLGAVITGAGPVYSVSWNAAGIASGPHTLSAVAADTAKNTAASSVSVIMDTTPPTVSLTAPTTGSSVNGTVTITANASDNAGINGVQFALDGVNLGSAVTGGGPSYSYSWNTLTAANGSHTLSAVAMDLAGNTAASASISVTVYNPPVGLIGYWNFDEGSGTIVHDSSGSGYNGTVNGALWIAGEINGALSFNGGAAYVVTPNIALGSAFSVSAWVNPAVTTQLGYGRILETQYNGGLYLGVNSSGTKYKFIVNTAPGPRAAVGWGTGARREEQSRPDGIW